MSSENPLDDLLAAERDAPDPPAEAQDRVWRRVSAAVALPVVPGVTSTAAAAAKGGLALKLGLGAGLLVGGGGLVVALQPEAEPQTPTVAKARNQKTIASVAPISPPSTVVSEAPPFDHALAAERALLADAANAVRRRDAGAARSALQRHATTFPGGRLVEEREAISLRVLLLEGDREAARAAALHFRARFPRSLLIDGIENALKNP